ncbi:MAG: hypothetical protein KF703_05125 [Actinobacteria bacterium]|nr:hypothetical protein [Actinomycetota bacterium]
MLVGLAGLVACEPPPPPALLAVNSTAIGADAVPGDGVCEVTPGVGDCTLQAAVGEGNALGRADIGLPAGSYPGSPSLSVTGALAIRRVGPGDVLVNQWVTVEQGATLELDGISSYNVPGAPFLVRGVLVGRHLNLAGLESSGQVVVAPTGTAVLENSIFVHVFGATPTIRNEGTVALRHVALRSWVSLGVTTPALSNSGHAVAVASILQTCTGTAPESRGANSDDDGSCGLTGPGDQPGAPPAVVLSVGSTVGYELDPAASPLIDAIPAGTLGCGTEVVDDQLGRVRPTDGDGDSVLACDIGARERPGP